jgi:hypothetical protein
MGPGWVIVIGLTAVGTAAFWIWGIVDTASHPEWAFRRAGQNKAFWIVLEVALGWFCTLLYLLSVRPRVLHQQLSWAGGPTPYAPPAVPEPAWFPDPQGTGMMRYWDGTVWTQYLRPDDRPAW